MIDVLATLALARKLSLNHSMWEYCLGYFNKWEDGKRLQGLKEGLCVNLSFGAEAQYLAPVFLSVGAASTLSESMDLVARRSAKIAGGHAGEHFRMQLGHS